MSAERYAPGFTLLEVLVAVLVVGLAFGGLLSLGASSTRSLARVHDRNEQALLAEERLRSVLADAAEGSIPALGRSAGSYEPPHEMLLWEVEVEEAGVPLAEGLPVELRSSSSVFSQPTGGARPPGGEQPPSLRRVTVRVYEDGFDPDDAIPFEAFVVLGADVGGALPDPTEPPR